MPRLFLTTLTFEACMSYCVLWLNPHVVHHGRGQYHGQAVLSPNSSLLDRAGCTQQGVEYTVYSVKDPSLGCDVNHNQGESFLQLNFPENSLTDTPRGLCLLGNSKASKVDNEDWPSQGQINPTSRVYL